MAVVLGDGLLGEALLHTHVLEHAGVSAGGGGGEVSTVELVGGLVGDNLLGELGLVVEGDLNDLLVLLGGL